MNNPQKTNESPQNDHEPELITDFAALGNRRSDATRLPDEQPLPLNIFPKLITSDELFGQDRQILIDHAGAVYRLQITKQGKLILTK